MAALRTNIFGGLICLAIAGACFVIFIVLLVIGGLALPPENRKVKTYANSICLVYSRYYKTYECTSRARKYSCYGPAWDVYYGANKTISSTVESNQRLEKSSDALEKIDEYKIGSRYSCWYDTTNPTVVQWEKPSVTRPVILLSVGGVFILLCGIFLFLGIRLVKQYKRRKIRNSVKPYP